MTTTTVMMMTVTTTMPTTMIATTTLLTPASNNARPLQPEGDGDRTAAAAGGATGQRLELCHTVRLPTIRYDCHGLTRMLLLLKHAC